MQLPLTERVHRLLGEERIDPTAAQYARIEALGTGEWAATFDHVYEDEWYEPDEIGKYLFSARAATLEEAVEQAAAKVLAAFTSDS